tara:strand:+ start:1391 stop:1675 length:285 start_codon:yes stop_codon:yes gene_type:complete
MAKIRNYWMMVNISEDRMGSLHGEPASEARRDDLEKRYGTSRAFAYRGQSLWYDVYGSLSKQAQRDLSSGRLWFVTVRMPIDLYENWVAYHAEQ